MFFYTAKDGTLMYMGKDKYENEDLIKYGWPEDVWFHVDNLSSAHVYVRLAPGKTMADIPDEVVRDCAQLVKENSIEGCKKNSVPVIYTPWANLRKDGSMATGQVSFHNPADVKKYIVIEKDKETLRRIEKTKEEKCANSWTGTTLRSFNVRAMRANTAHTVTWRESGFRCTRSFAGIPTWPSKGKPGTPRRSPS